ncbi:probable serine/threonine-protein kinase At1g54610 isoform X1 [Pistacia vera]|uniref:probable serine/threonine-protein kinase At1g54610 isoform X1 n=1 Tax=Pistacia vera TaxID=55513 RepID=UPI0012635870|nr:probable serine/threonine-protein kinase At1g54610 isoform X1 [Pistacia vera]
MGCVLGKGDRRNTCDRRRSSENACSAVTVTVSEDVNHVVRVKEEEKTINRNDIRRHTGDFPPPERRRIGTETQQGWPSWLMAVAGDAIRDWTPRRASTFEKLDKIGQGTYSNVYKARDLVTGKIVALKKVRFDNLEPESVKFMAREILVLRRLDHPNVIKLEGLVTSRMSCSLYLVFEYMEHDLAGLAACQTVKFTEPQIKCYMRQLLSGLEHCHNQGVLHRDIKGSNLLIDNEGILKIADFGLATFYDPRNKQPMTSRVVTLWYRPPELLLGATYYGVGVDLWSAGCILAELLAGKPIMPGRTEVEQLHKIFKLCGSPSEEYWKKSKLPNATLFKPQQPYKRCIAETFKDFPSSSLPLIETLLSIDPDERGTATAALDSEFFTTEPHACEPSSLPKYPPSKEMDVKLRDEEARRQRGLSGKASAVDGARRVRVRDRVGRAIPAPEANAEIQANLDRWRVVTQGNAKSKSEKFPPPHQDGAVGHPQNASGKAPDIFITSSTFNPKSSAAACAKSTGAFGGPSRKRKPNKEDPQMAPSRNFIRGFKPSSIGLSLDMIFKGKSKSEVFGNRKIENNGIS